MAEVYRALDVTLGREVAVKVLPQSLAVDPNYVQRFRKEAQRVAKLRHPHIVPVYTYNEQDGLLYLVMPILRESLRDRMDRNDPVSLGQVADLVSEVASALQVAHEAGLVHRDVKPENILLDGDGHAWLTDFGIAREVLPRQQGDGAQTLAATGLPVGTPEYMAPEQLRGGPVDQRADIYALGTVLYELLTRRVPHAADTPYEVASLVLTRDPVPPSELNADVPIPLEHVVLRALDKSPSRRFPDARGFADALNRAVKTQRNTTLPAGEWPRTTRRFSRPLVADGDAPTYRPITAMPTQQLGGRAGNVRRSMLLLSLLAAMVAAVAGGSALALLNGGVPGIAGLTQAFTGGSFNPPRATPTVTPVATSTPKPTPTPRPTATPQPTATPHPPVLTFSQTTIAFTPNSKNVCTTTLTINNSSQRTLGWYWQSMEPAPDYAFMYQVNGGETGDGAISLPKDLSPGIAAGGADTLKMTFSSCSRRRFPYTVSVVDTAGQSYTLTLRYAKSG